MTTDIVSHPRDAGGQKQMVVRTVCEQCYYQCGVLAFVENGRIMRIKGDPEHPQYDGRMCPKGGSHLQELYSPDRLLYPLKKDRGGWQRVSWEDALEEIADRLKDIKEKYGALAISADSDGGPRQVWNSLLVRALGSPNVFLNTMTCSSALQIGDVATYGEWITWDFPPDFANSQCILVAGSNPAVHCPPSWHRITQAMKRGAKLITIDPRFTECAGKSDIWLRPLPGTDAALGLGMAKVMIEEELYDAEFVSEWCHGFEDFSKRASEYPLERVSQITGVPQEEIAKAARTFATTKPACMHIRNGISGHPGGTQAVRALTTLLALTGNLDIPGGNRFFTSFKREKGIIDQFMIHRMPEFRLPREIEAKMIGSEEFPLYSGPDSIVQAAHGSLLFKAMLTGRPYPVRAMIVMMSNPVITHPNSIEVREALKSLDLLVVAEKVMTPTAQLAHFVLPVSDYYERDEVCDLCYRDFISVRQKVVDPPGECKDDRDIVFELAARLEAKGCLDHPSVMPWRSIEEFNNFRIERFGMTFDQLKEQGIVRLTPEYERYKRKGGFATGTGKVELYSTFLEKWGFDPLPAYEEDKQTSVSTQKDFPLLLITGARHWAFKNSEMRTNPWLKKVLPDPLVEVNPDTAAALGIEDGDWIAIETPFGGPVRQRAHFVQHMHPVCVAAQDGWWFPNRPEGGWRDSNINMVTPTDIESHDPISGMQLLKGIPCRIYRVEAAGGERSLAKGG